MPVVLHKVDKRACWLAAAAEQVGNDDARCRNVSAAHIMQADTQAGAS